LFARWTIFAESRGHRTNGSRAIWFNPFVRRSRRPSGPWPALLVASLGLMSCGGSSDASSTGALRAPSFVDDTAGAGLDHAYTGEFEFFVGGGVATFDCDGDGLDDLYLAGGTSPASLYRNDSTIGGELRFARVPSPLTDLDAVTGAYPIDVDSDDVADLVVLRRGSGNVVLRGLGDCAFEDATAQLGVDGGEAWTAAFSATWEGSNALPTLAFGNYLVPDTSDCAPSALVRPAAADEYGPPIALAPGYCTLSVLFSDWSRSGTRDLRMTNDRHYYLDGEDQLWRIAPGEAPREYTEADGWRPLHLWGMGIASQDLDGDGRPEVFLTSQGDNKLQTLDGPTRQPAYRDIALDSGVTAQRPYTGGDVLPSTAWHPEFDDVNNDGFVDLLVTKGNVEAQPDYASRDPSNLFLGQPDGSFVEGAVDAGIVDFDPSRGAALADLNLDGLLDLVVVHRRTDVRVWRNLGSGDAARPAPMGHWLGLRLHQPAPNVDAIGAWLEVRVGDRVVSREVTIGGGHASGQLGWVHVGLGDATDAEVRVEWPDGEMGPWMEVGADQYAVIERGLDVVRPWHREGAP
jgi:hypothetical protein